MEKWIVGCGFLGTGLIFILTVLLVWGLQRRQKARATGRVMAAVIEIRRIRRDGSTTFFPVYEFYADGALQRVQSRVSSSRCPFQVGDAVELHFEPSNPKHIYVEKEEKIYRFLYYIFLGLGSVFTIMGVCVFFVL